MIKVNIDGVSCTRRVSDIVTGLVNGDICNVALTSDDVEKDYIFVDISGGVYRVFTDDDFNCFSDKVSAAKYLKTYIILNVCFYNTITIV